MKEVLKKLRLLGTKTKARDRDDNGRICRKYTSRHKWAAHYGKSPGWWVNLFMTRPQRVEERRLCKLLERGRVDGDEVTFPLGNRKPHKYYW